MLSSDDLVLCAGTLPRGTFAEKVEAVSRAGFAGMSLYLADYEGARAQGHSDADLRAMLADRGLAVAEVDPLLDWIPTASPGGAKGDATGFFGYTERDFYAAADALGARSLNAVVFSDAPLAHEEIVEAFAGLCDRAAEHGLLVHLEFLPWTRIRDFEVALSVVTEADRGNGGLMLDSWHHFRSGRANEELRGIPPDRILAIQLNDAPRTPWENVVEETLHGRLLPGEGDIDLVDLVRTLDEIGCAAPVGVEVFSDELAALPPAEAAQRAADATRALLARARSS